MWFNAGPTLLLIPVSKQHGDLKTTAKNVNLRMAIPSWGLERSTTWQGGDGTEWVSFCHTFWCYSVLAHGT